MRKKLAYVAGPISKGDIVANLMKAHDAGMALLKGGLAVIVPHGNCFWGNLTKGGYHLPSAFVPEACPGGTTHADWMGCDLEIVRRCDAVLVIEGWKNSEGARGEVDEAVRLGLPVLYEWGDKSYLADILRRLAATPDGYRCRSNDPRQDAYWMSATGPAGLA